MKLLFFTDSHVGHPGGSNSFCMNPIWLEGTNELFRRLRTLIDKEGIELVLHGGDIVHDSRDRDSINRALDLLSSLQLPVRAVFGNHDLLDENAESEWRLRLAAYPAIKVASEVESHSTFHLLTINLGWLDPEGRISNRWQSDFQPIPAIDSVLAADLSRSLELIEDEKPVVLVVHHPLFTPPDQVVTTAYQKAMEAFADTIHSIVSPRRRVLMLSGHVHLTRTLFHSKEFVSSSLGSFIEWPFQVRIIELLDEAFSVTTRSLDDIKLEIAGNISDRDFQV
jgi:3',5'-cyclic AMP phosphodiesterase CpdA